MSLPIDIKVSSDDNGQNSSATDEKFSPINTTLTTLRHTTHQRVLSLILLSHFSIYSVSEEKEAHTTLNMKTYHSLSRIHVDFYLIFITYKWVKLRNGKRLLLTRKNRSTFFFGATNLQV
jgi:hypothetical protein